MFCPKCGTQNPETGKFCRNCGTDLSPVSDALSGERSNFQIPDVWMTSPRQMRRNMRMAGKKEKPIHWEGAITKLFSGLAFLVVSIALAFSQMGHGWWFWMLIPAFGSIGSGIAQIIQLKKTEKHQSLISPQQTNQVFAPVSNVELPPSKNDYIKPQGSIYDTGELVAPPSVVEGTTRHLEINNEGETMTLPKK